MCKFNDLSVPSVGWAEIEGLKNQERSCSTARILDKCKQNCEECIFYAENLEDYLEYYNMQMSEIL